MPHVLWTSVDPNAMGLDAATEAGTFDNARAGTDEKFLVQSLRDQSNWNALVRRVGDVADVQRLADRLTVACRDFPMDRWSLVTTCGRNALARKKAFQDVLEEELGPKKVQFKIVESDVKQFDESTTTAVGRAMRAMCGLAPTLWVQIYV